MASLNKVFLIGNLTRDPELRYTPSGAAVSDLGLAVNRVYTTKEGDRREETVFVDVTVWNRQAENCCQYLRKGRPVHVEGSLKLDSWDDKTTGEKRSRLKVEAISVQFLDSGKRDESGGPPPSEDGYAPSSREAPRRAAPEPRAAAGNGPNRSYQPAPATSPRRTAPAAPPADDEDIPF